MKVTPHRYRSNALDRDAYMRGRDDAMAGLERFPQCQHPNQYGAYNAGFYDCHKLQAFSAMLAARGDDGTRPRAPAIMGPRNGETTMARKLHVRPYQYRPGKGVEILEGATIVATVLGTSYPLGSACQEDRDFAAVTGVPENEVSLVA